MNEKITLPYLIVVEGKYDKIKLDSIFDAVIICTDGFGIFKDDEKIEFIKKYASETGVVIATDSDSAGFIIRNFIKNKLYGKKIYNVYIPDVFGKEKRKEKKSSEGKLGVEGIEKELIIKSFERAGLLNAPEQKSEGDGNYGKDNKVLLTKSDLFMMGFSGGVNSKSMYKTLLKELELPQNMNVNTMLEVVNRTMNTAEVKNIMENIKNTLTIEN